MLNDDDDNLNLDAIVSPELGDEFLTAIPAGSIPPAVTLLDPIPPLREVHARLVRLGAEGSGTSAPAASSEGADVEKNAVLLEDSDGFAPQTAVLSMWAYTLSLLFNGRRSAVEVSELFKKKYGHDIQPEQALVLQNELEQAMFLSSSTFEERLNQRLNNYLEMPAWPAAHSGTAYPDSPASLMAVIEGFFANPKGPGELAEALPVPVDTTRALIIPHIDLNVGGPTYAHAYRELLETTQAELIVVLGVAHQCTGDHLYSVSQKDFETPSGVLHTARDIAKRLHEASQTDEIAAELSHRGEHSIEFQAVLLQTLLATRSKRTIEIVPILCGAIDRFLARDERPFDNDAFVRFTSALRHELDNCGRKWCVICSVDFSHVGPEFQHSSMIDERLLKPIERMDMKDLKLIEKLDADGFFADIARTQNSRHVDAVLAVLTMLVACKGLLKGGRLLHYDQLLKAHTHSAVSYAAMVFDGN